MDLSGYLNIYILYLIPHTTTKMLTIKKTSGEVTNNGDIRFMEIVPFLTCPTFCNDLINKNK